MNRGVILNMPVYIHISLLICKELLGCVRQQCSGHIIKVKIHHRVIFFYLKNVTGQVSHSLFFPHTEQITQSLICCQRSVVQLSVPPPSLTPSGRTSEALTVIRRQVFLHVLNYIKPTNPCRLKPPTDLDCHYVFHKRSTLRFYIQKI